jgi:hypothetical protein
LEAHQDVQMAHQEALMILQLGFLRWTVFLNRVGEFVPACVVSFNAVQLQWLS